MVFCRIASGRETVEKKKKNVLVLGMKLLVIRYWSFIACAVRQYCSLFMYSWAIRIKNKEKDIVI